MISDEQIRQNFYRVMVDFNCYKNPKSTNVSDFFYRWVYANFIHKKREEQLERQRQQEQQEEEERESQKWSSKLRRGVASVYHCLTCRSSHKYEKVSMTEMNNLNVKMHKWFKYLFYY